ncbi:10241_t:CDS:1, partial [Dentiscutata heterogama]
MSSNTKDYKLLIEEDNANITTYQPPLISMKDNLSYISSLAATGILPILTYCAA